jgi:hypothetical protein
MSAVEASRFLRPPGWFKRRFELPKLRKSQGAFNPVQRLVDLKQKSRQFETLPEARRVPVARQFRAKPLQPITTVPVVSSEILERRLDFLLSPKAVHQQRSAPVIPGTTVYQTELFVWERQMREIRRIYRAQYFQRLAEVTESEIVRERQLYLSEQAARREKRRAKLEKRSLELKRQALAADARRIESRVNETLEISRRHKIRLRRLAQLNPLVSLSRPISDLPKSKRNINTTFLAGQLGAASSRPLQKSRKIARTKNIFRETLERSYDLLPEDSLDLPDLATPPGERGLTAEQRADLYYVGFSEQDKLELIETKLSMLQRRLRAEEIHGEGTDVVTQQLIDILTAAKAAHLEAETVRNLKQNISDNVDDGGNSLS